MRLSKKEKEIYNKFVSFLHQSGMCSGCDLDPCPYSNPHKDSISLFKCAWDSDGESWVSFAEEQGGISAGRAIKIAEKLLRK